MTEPDDLSVLSKEPFRQALSTLDSFMAETGRVFLIGAGCSACAGVPLMDKLTVDVLNNDGLDATTAGILKGVQACFSGADKPNIEDYLSEIVDLLAITERRSERGAVESKTRIGEAGYTGQQLREAVEKIKLAIVSIIEGKNRKMDISVHRSFVRAVHRPRRPGKTDGVDSVCYLCLNYDTLLEDALALERVPFADGLDGGATGWWSPSVFERSGLLAKVYKLHGSINWSELDNDPLPRRVVSNVDVGHQGDKHILIWPASTKYRETQLDPYATLMSLGRSALGASSPGSQKILFICGYRFADAHINFEIDRALRESRGQLTTVVFTSDDTPQGLVKAWHDDPGLTKQVLVFTKRGFFHGATCEQSGDADLPWWKFENMVRLLEGER